MQKYIFHTEKGKKAQTYSENPSTRRKKPPGVPGLPQGGTLDDERPPEKPIRITHASGKGQHRSFYLINAALIRL